VAIIGVAINKTIPFRGTEHPVSNVYHYEVPADLAGGYQGIVDDIVNAEAELHSSLVKFVSARVWSAGGTPAQNQTLLITDLTGVGARSQMAALDSERAVLLQWDAGRSDSTGRRIYLRKWFHVAGFFATMWTDDELGNKGQIRASIRDEIEGYAQALTNVGPTIDDNWRLCSSTGRQAVSDAPTCHPYLEHHQLGDQWR
jgi:hypothetical protein